MKIKDIISTLEQIAPVTLQESYDNSGLLVGHEEDECTGVLVCLDSVEEVILEAVRKGCNLVVAHHPILFSGLKRLNGKNYVERTILLAIRHQIAIYAVHTNLDNVYGGVNAEIGARLGLSQTSVLRPLKGGLLKLVTFVPMAGANDLRNALWRAGAGQIGNYDQCSFNLQGLGTFRAGDKSTPHVGMRGELHSEKEERIELIFPKHRESMVMQALKEAHPYEEVAFYLSELRNTWQEAGSGLFGILPEPLEVPEFLQLLKKTFAAQVVRHTAFSGQVYKVVICGGAGSFLLRDAIAAGADAFVTADFKYHEFFDAEGRLMICDIGHYESEQFTIQLIGRILSKNYPKFAVIFTETSTNPVHYF